MRSALILATAAIGCSCSFSDPSRSSSLDGPAMVSSAPEGSDSTIALRFAPPEGFTRTTEDPGSFASYLRSLPLKEAGVPVHLYNGDQKSRQDVHAAVIDVSVGKADLQQCADAVMRLRAEYLFSVGRQDEVAFHFTNGFLAEWKRWRQGERIVVNGNNCSWSDRSAPNAAHEEFLRYLQQVFMYAGSLSLQRELDASTPSDLSASDLKPGDVFIQGGSPGHAMIVVDVAAHADGRKAFLLAQSYMPAQEVHVVKNLQDHELGAWFLLEGDDKLYAPEWTFGWGDRRRW